MNKQEVYLSGFRYAIYFEGNEDLLELVGEKYCMPPEMILDMGYNFLLDIWGLGIVYYYMIYGKYPFKDEDEFDQCRLICTGSYDLPENISVES